MGRFERLIEMLKENPKDNFLRHALALEYVKAGDDTTAKNIFEEILSESPDYTGSYYHLARLLERLDETDLAVTWYKKGLEATQLNGDTHAFNELKAAYEDLIF
ncbi:MAG: tetratricopeptide repeat protein [Bacteroidetes bacterium]|nr:tetratricopeptide repeat protein [Bacteroidota bacterium]